jgi:hypothetical protein
MADSPAGAKEEDQAKKISFRFCREWYVHRHSHCHCYGKMCDEPYNDNPN